MGEATEGLSPEGDVSRGISMPSSEARSVSGPSSEVRNSAIYRNYVLILLTLVCTFNYLDRALVVLLLQPIADDLRLSDTQLGFLTGIAFGIFYATAGIPIARWADRGDRSTITSLAIGLWGLTVMACFLVTNYLQLVFARVAAGVGEAGGMPPTYSLVGDYFPEPAARTRAMTVYMLASPMAFLVSFIVGAWLNARFGWRATFFLMGLPALALALLVRLTVRDPRVLNSGAKQAHSVPPFREVLAAIWRTKSSRHLVMAVIIFFTLGLGLGPWYAAFMLRSHGMAISELGIWLGLIFGLGGLSGIALGGVLSDRLGRRSAAIQMRMSGVSAALLLPLLVTFLVVQNKYASLLALFPVMLMFNFFLGPTFALMQRLVPDEIRAVSLSVVMLLANLIGMGIGPQLVGISSDLLAKPFGTDSLRIAMLVMSLSALWASYHLLKAAKTIDQDLELTEQPKLLEIQ
jgi:MFS family permease